MNIRKNNYDKSLILNTSGLNVEIKPYFFLKESLSKNSQSIIDSIIEDKFKSIISDFLSWRQMEFKENLDYNQEVHVKQIQDFADFFREVLPLHSDWECIELSEIEKDALKEVSDYWKYNEFYSFKSSETINLNL